MIQLEKSDQNVCVIGIDLGGTNVRACAYYADGTTDCSPDSIPSQAQNGDEAIFNAIAEVVSKAASKAKKEIKSIGMAIPGIVDNENGVVRWAPNFGKTVDGVFKYWENIEVRKGLDGRLPAPLHMGNDANLAALGEYKFGSGRNSASSLVMLTVGTGIGGGVVLSSKAVSGKAEGTLLLLGGNQGGVELGHTVIQQNGLDCQAGTYGAIEAYCQRDSIIHRAQHRLLRKRPSILHDMVGGDYSKLTPYHLSQAAEDGDQLAIQVWEEVGSSLGIGIGNFINIFAPEIVAIGGQIAKAGKFLIDPAIRAAQDVAIPALFSYATILEAVHVDDAGLLGGAALAIESLV